MLKMLKEQKNVIRKNEPKSVSVVVQTSLMLCHRHIVIRGASDMGPGATLSRAGAFFQFPCRSAYNFWCRVSPFPRLPRGWLCAQPDLCLAEAQVLYMVKFCLTKCLNGNAGTCKIEENVLVFMCFWTSCMYSNSLIKGHKKTNTVSISSFIQI